MHLNLQNVEEIIFMDKNVHKFLPEFKYLFDSWTLANRITALRNLGKRSLLDLLNNLKENHLQKLSDYFKQNVIVDKLDYHIVHNIETNLDGIVEELNKYDNFLDVTVYRKDSHVYISIWK